MNNRNKGNSQMRVAMTPETKLALQAITSPFKASDNSAKFPDGHGGFSFSTTDKLRRSENLSVWIDDIKQANTQWTQFSSTLAPRESVDITQANEGPLPINVPGALTSVYKSEQPYSGWNIIANNLPIFPFANDSPVMPSPSHPDVAGKGYFTWTDIQVNKVYYFAVPGVQVDCTRGNLGGPSNNVEVSPPDGGYSTGSQGIDASGVTAAQQTMWQAEHDLELQQCYGMQLSAPVQVYRVLDFTYSVPGLQPSEETDTSLEETVAMVRAIYPTHTPEEVMAKVQSLVSDNSDPIRYRCQTIHPLAGVTQWEDFSSQLGRTLWRSVNFPLIAPAPTLDSPIAKRVPVKQRPSLRFHDFNVATIEDCVAEDVARAALEIPQTPGINSPVYIGSSQAVDSGPIVTLSVPDDFTYHEGHNGTQKIGPMSKVKLATYKIDDTGGFAPDTSVVTSSTSIEFKGGLVEARRVVGFGMKLFSTEAAITANGRIVGGELPLGLVNDLINFQDQAYTHPETAAHVFNASGITGLDWKPLPDKMDQWTEKIESRLEDYTAFTALDGCTVRYNTLQTEEQSEYIYTNNDSRISLLPLQLGYVNDPLNAEFQLLADQATVFSRLRAEIPMPYHPPCDGSEMVPVICFAPADPVRSNYSTSSVDENDQEGLFFQAVIHTENLTSNQFPIECEESVYDPNWELYTRICAEPSNFPIVVKGHSFGSFMRKASKVTRTAMKFGAKAIEVGEVMLPLLEMA